MDQRRTIKVDPDLHRRMAEVARRNGFKVSGFAEQAIKQLIQRLDAEART